MWRLSSGAGPVKTSQNAAVQDDDLALLRAVAQGDAPALEELYRRHARSLFAYIYTRLRDEQLAEETLQDVMLVLWRSAGNFRADASVRTWLFAVARKRCATMWRRRPRDLPLLAEELLPAADTPGPEEKTISAFSRGAVRAALEQLPAHQRETVELVYLHGLSGPEAAAVMRVPVGTVKSRLSRALKALAPLLAEVEP